MIGNGILFFEEYFNYMDDLTPEQYCQLMRLIKDLRFNNIDTKPEDVQDKDVRLVWRIIRPSVLKSRRNTKHYSKKQQSMEPQEPTPEMDNSDFEFEPQEEEMRNVLPIEQPQQFVDTKPKKDKGLQEWLVSIKNGGSKGQTEYQVFNNYWSWYFDDIGTADNYVREYLKQFNIYKKFI